MLREAQSDNSGFARPWRTQWTRPRLSQGQQPKRTVYSSGSWM